VKKKLPIVLAAFLAVALAAAAVLWRMMTGPLYHPGDVRASNRPLEPLADAGPNRWVAGPGVELHHFEQGQGRAALMVHGGPGFAPEKPWRAGELLAGRLRLVYYHQRGCGLSSRPIATLAGRDFYSNMTALHRTLGLPPQIADIERIRRTLGQERLLLIGHSFGAFIAALYAAEFPERVSALVLVAPADVVVLPSPDGGLFELIRRRLPPAMRSEYGDYLEEYFDFRRAFSRTERESSEFYARIAKYYGAAYHAGGTGLLSPGYTPLATFLSMGKRHDYSDAMRRVGAPVLVVHGADDLQSEAASRRFAALFPNSRFVVIAGAGHFVFDQQPAAFAAALREFLGLT